MKKKLSRHGRRFAVIIDKPILELLAINEKTILAIKTDGKRIIIEPLQRTHSVISENPKIQAAYDDVMQRYQEAFRELARQ
jgi:bifunctional DNA-binding transcriptional regulator/antitoxin component of YhaV-PrlF toxin-antitoxin module